ncbi:Mrp/NBP35 family ATP-binding protein [Acuticoccus sp. MNP-M23]|uniref:Mrp/NBP35 family ATP-binding protein n=1 Tax=Acuticoccus sp. MNP-M23 TaxID=3072793 RepID=UPI0028165A0A|nr:Mrp/NBP35 family ATP-binding protein [Acuticoccus sp. MNP-M23]WMS42254.1 Mrp/NBP35 family ATP-binding protein [Acuticoccus sp. MNP-M23]
MADDQVNRAAVEAALADVTMPDGGALALSRIRSLVVENGRVGFAIAVAPGERAAMEPVRADAQRRVEALAGVDRVLAALLEEGAPPAEARRGNGIMGKVKRLAGVGRPGGAAPTGNSGTDEKSAPPPRPAPPAAEAPAAQAKGGGARTGPVDGIARIVAVGSGKGGVGKSTVSFNLAVALAATGWRVGLLDADIYGPSVPTLMGVNDHNPQTEPGGFAPVSAFGIKAMSIGYLIKPEQPVVWRGPMVTGALNQLLRDTRWGPLDCLIIDMPPGTGDIQLSLAQQTPLDGAVLVTTPQDLALVDVRKAAQMFRTVKIPLLGMVENMATFVCQSCGAETAIFGHGGGEAEAAATDVPFLGAIALTMAIREAADAGRPVALDDTGEGAAYRRIAEGLKASLEGVTGKPFPKIVFEDA